MFEQILWSIEDELTVCLQIIRDAEKWVQIYDRTKGENELPPFEDEISMNFI